MHRLPASKNRRVLVIDDNRSIHDDFRKILCPATGADAEIAAMETAVFGAAAEPTPEMNFEVDSAYQGQDGVASAKAALEAGLPYALTFVDVRMPPGWDGVETARRLWELDPSLQVVLCTAYSDYSWGEMFKELGHRDGLLILKKPFDAVEALQMAHALTEKWRLHQQSQQRLNELESVVAERTRELQDVNQTLRKEALELQRSDEALRESEARFSGAFAHAPIGMALVSPAGRWLKVNHAICEVVGYSEAELLSRTFQEITHPDDLESDLANVHLLLAGQIRSYQMEKRYIHQRGNFVSVLLNVSLVRDGQGEPLYFVSQIQDITERKRAEEELRWKSAFLEAQVSSSIDGILVVDEHGKKILQNQRVSHLMNIPPHIADDPDDQKQVRWVTGIVKQPAQFIAGVVYLYAHPSEISRDEIELKDGKILDRYSSPVVGLDGKYYGRIWTFRDITERKRMEESLRESNEKFHQLADNITDAFWIRSPDLRDIHYISPAFERIWGRPVEDLYANPGLWAKLILPDDRDRVQAAFASLVGDVQSLEIEYRILRPDGEIRWVRVRAFQVRGAADQPTRHTGIVADITERKRLEAQLFQSQKMETVGRLAGGVAHEFNSILTAIIGQTDLLLNDLPNGNPLRHGATEIRHAADRAAILTRHLLAYGRKQILRPETLDLGLVLAALEGAIRHLMGRGTTVHFAPAAGLKSVKADIGQIEQVIMNVAMNAADAMPNGGTLTLETSRVTLDAEYVRPFPELKAGDYVMLAITDTGAGMSEKIKARIFEPFFSTKGVGEGTGLGLSICDGILKQSGGHIAVYSEPGRGTTIKIYLPQVEAQAQILPARPAATDLPRGTETVLLVEDDPSLREMAGGLLRRLGYKVLAAADGVEALRLRQRPEVGHVDLLFTDVAMPHMSGTELWERVTAQSPHTRVLFTSAFAENAITHQGALHPGAALLQKPFTPSALARKVREVLDRTNADPI